VKKVKSQDMKPQDVQRLERQRNHVARLPTCLVIGPQRAGTTWIHEYLARHPDVTVPHGVKETFFFDRRYQRGIAWYARHFRPTVERPNQRILEVGPSYFHHPAIPARVHKHLGSIPLVCTLRNPAERSFSLYLLLRSYGLTRSTFRKAVQERPEILDTSRYCTHVKRWFEVFGRRRMLFLFQETLAADPKTYARQICEHLEIPRLPIDASLAKPVNRPSVPHSGHLARVGLHASEALRGMGAYGALEIAKKMGLKRLFYGKPGSHKLPRLTDEDRQWLVKQLGDEIDGLEEFLKVDLSHWKTIPCSSRAA